jgi:hypothetical protein
LTSEASIPTLIYLIREKDQFAPTVVYSQFKGIGALWILETKLIIQAIIVG